MVNVMSESDGAGTVPSKLGRYNYSNSTPDIASTATQKFLTPSQRYRLRKERTPMSLRRSIQSKERYYDEMESEAGGTVDDVLSWNVPVQSLSSASMLHNNQTNSPYMGRHMTKTRSELGLNNNAKRHSLNSVSSLSKLDDIEMPTSPMPGDKQTSEFQYMQNTTESLTSVYINSSNRLSRTKLSERTESAEWLPIELKEASEKGMEDLLLVSDDKLDLVSHSRPSWLPPKGAAEKKSNELEISNRLSLISLNELDKSRSRDIRKTRDENNTKTYNLLLQKGVLRKSSINKLRKIVWETPLPYVERLDMYNDLLQGQDGFISATYVETFDEMMRVLESMVFPQNKDAEIQQLIEKSIRTKISGKYPVSSELVLLLQLKAISRQGLLPGDELLFHHMLQAGTAPAKIWKLVNTVQLICFNDCIKEKYDQKIMDNSSVVGSYLTKDGSFAAEFNTQCLNSTTWWNILSRMDHNLFLWCMDCVIVHNADNFSPQAVPFEQFQKAHLMNNYKILMSLTLNVLLNYHFGFYNLQQLRDVADTSFCIPLSPDESITENDINFAFIQKWHHYFKKL